MKVNDLIQTRVVNQGLAASKFETCADVVSHFGGIQSQDYAMAKWAVGMRMRKASDSEVEQCVNSGQIIRTHILRPTWHFVNKQDIRWMMELTAPNIKKATQYVDKQVGLTDAVYKKLWKIIAVELAHEDNLTKEDLLERLGKKKIKVESLLLTQLLMRAEVDMRVCSGIRKTKQATYSLFDNRIPEAHPISRKDSLVKLASIYFHSRGPATVKDFMWWSGLSLADAKFGIAGLGPNLKSASVDGLNYWYLENGDYSQKKISALLPAYDEFMVGYSEGRSIAFPPGLDKSVLGNGIFKPIVLSKNTLVGTWKKISQEPFVEVQFLQGNGKDKGINSSVKTFQLFLQKQEK